ncbi:2-hydroxychromene-2-carboxylate isomerase [compost metagenome]
MAEVLTQNGFAPNEVLALTADEEVKTLLKDNTEKAVQRGVFGAPSMFVGNHMYFGQDRLDFVIEALR